MHREKFPYSETLYDELILRRNFYAAKYTYGEFLCAEISLRWNFLMANFPYGEVSYDETSHGENSYSEIASHAYIQLSTCLYNLQLVVVKFFFYQDKIQVWVSIMICFLWVRIYFLGVLHDVFSTRASYLLLK